MPSGQDAHHSRRGSGAIFVFRYTLQNARLTFGGLNLTMVPASPPVGIHADDSLIYDTPSRWSTTREVASDSSFDKSLMASTSLSASFFSPKFTPGRSTPPGLPDESQRLVAHLTQIENAALLSKSPLNGRGNAVSRRGPDCTEAWKVCLVWRRCAVLTNLGAHRLAQPA